MSIDPRQVQDVFLAAADCASAAEREELLALHCGNDAEVRARVEALLLAHDGPGELPSVAIGFDETVVDDLCHESGAVIANRYRLLNEISTGGMGRVWLAQQFDPVQRLVALKVIKAGLNTQRGLARFEAERQALALTEHAHIARVYDGGLTDAGQPFFVMEYVEGPAITDYCDDRRLTIDDRVRLFIKVCRAVHYAHQKGVIHRDLKPSNVLVAREGDLALPKIIDFGLAKALPDATCSSQHSATNGQIMGTPRYMSPEQAEIGNLDIDTRTDVYSLGVILFELLTGATPLTAARIKGLPLAETLRLTRELDPPRPSAQFEHVPPSPEVAAARGAQTRTLPRLVRGDLDWIVGKALARDRAQRYEAAADLARDLERYLRHEPVRAHPATPVYRLRKFARRQRFALAALVLVAMALVGSTIVSTVAAVRATSAMRDAEAARRDEAQHRQIAEQRRAEAERQREEAESNFTSAQDAINAYFTGILASKALSAPELAPLRRDLLAAALAHYQRFIDKCSDNPALDDELASASLQAGELSRAFGTHRDAIGALRQAVARYDTIIQRQPEDDASAMQLARALSGLGFEEHMDGQLGEAQNSCRAALATYRQVATRHPADRLLQAHVAGAFKNLAQVQVAAHKPAEAEASLREALATYERLSSDDPADDFSRIELANSHDQLGRLLLANGRLDAAEQPFRRTIEIFADLAQRSAATESMTSALALASFQLGQVHRQAGQHEPAREQFKHALELFELLEKGHPANTIYRDGRASARQALDALPPISE